MTAFTYFKDQWTPIIDDYLAKHLASEVKDQKISQIMAYSVMAGGKRLRPLLFLATLNTLGKKIEEPEVRIACGIELIHTYSLIHDDLPAMDNDDYRRGKLTSHKKWGEAEAILAGDALCPASGSCRHGRRTGPGVLHLRRHGSRQLGIFRYREKAGQTGQAHHHHRH